MWNNLSFKYICHVEFTSIVINNDWFWWWHLNDKDYEDIFSDNDDGDNNVDENDKYLSSRSIIYFITSNYKSYILVKVQYPTYVFLTWIYSYEYNKTLFSHPVRICLTQFHNNLPSSDGHK